MPRLFVEQPLASAGSDKKTLAMMAFRDITLTVIALTEKNHAEISYSQR